MGFARCGPTLSERATMATSQRVAIPQWRGRDGSPGTKTHQGRSAPERQRFRHAARVVRVWPARSTAFALALISLQVVKCGTRRCEKLALARCG